MTHSHPRQKPMRTVLFAGAIAACAAMASGCFSAEATPAPAPLTPFTLPLADHTTTTAQILPGPEANAWLVYSTPSGQLAVYTLSPAAPDPNPPPPPPPPPGQALHVAVVENPTASTPTQRAILADPRWREAIPPPHSFIGIIPADILDPDTQEPPPGLRPFLAAAKGTPLPAVILLLPDGSPFRVISLPDNVHALVSFLAECGVLPHANTRHQ